MASKIEQLVEAMEARFEALQGLAVPFAFGVLSKDKLGAPPRIVAVPQPGKVLPPGHTSRKRRGSAPFLYLKAHVLRFECWGSTSEFAEALHDGLLRVVRRDLHSNAELGAWGWITHEAQNAGHNVQGSKIYQIITVRIPVIDEAAPLVTIEGTEQSGWFGEEMTGDPDVS